MTDFEDRLAELERRAGISDRADQVFEVPAPEPVSTISDRQVDELLQMVPRIPASLARAALIGYIRRDPAHFAHFAEFTRMAERFPPAGYTYGGSADLTGPEKPSQRECPVCHAAPFTPCTAVRSGAMARTLRASHPARSKR